MQTEAGNKIQIRRIRTGNEAHAGLVHHRNDSASYLPTRLVVRLRRSLLSLFKYRMPTLAHRLRNVFQTAVLEKEVFIFEMNYLTVSNDCRARPCPIARQNSKKLAGFLLVKRQRGFRFVQRPAIR